LGNSTTFSSSSSVIRSSAGGGGGATANMDGTAGGINLGPSEVLGAGNFISSNSGSSDDSFLASVERNSLTSRIIFEREEESFDFPSAERYCFVFLDPRLFRFELALSFLLPLF
jgi:hypothetical protein